MSGIFAIVHRDGKRVDSKILRQMAEPLQYLGPDCQDIWFSNNLGLVHTLFRTTNESVNEHQPCTLDGNVYISADVRIDGRAELVKQLQDLGCPATEDVPDVNLILYAYQVWDTACLQYLLGDFAFILWDEPQQRLFCARDRFGMRRLYYSESTDSLIFSNSLDCLLQYPNVSDRLNQQAIGDFLILGGHNWIDKAATCFADIRKLPPAHYLIFQDQQITLQSYWQFPTTTPLLKYRHQNDYISHFKTVFIQAVQDRMRCDNLVISMSGGLDSTTIAATVSQIAKNQTNQTKIQALTGVYDRLFQDEERYYSGLVAQKLDIPIHYFCCDNYLLLKPFQPLVEPAEFYVPAMNIDMGRMSANLGRVVLNGNSGDNLLFMSPLKNSPEDMQPLSLLKQTITLWQHFSRFPSLGTGLIAKLKGKVKSNYHQPSYPYPCWLNTEFERRFDLKERWNSFWSWEPSNLHPRHPEIQKFLLSPDWSGNLEYYSNIDFNPPEHRDPFLDLRLVEFILSLPLLPWLYQKYLLRLAMKDQLPAAVCQRPKTPLGMIHQVLLQKSADEWVDHWQTSPQVLEYVNRHKIPSIARGASEPSHSYVHLRPLILNLWFQGR